MNNTAISEPLLEISGIFRVFILIKLLSKHDTRFNLLTSLNIIPIMLILFYEIEFIKTEQKVDYESLW